VRVGTLRFCPPYDSPDTSSGIRVIPWCSSACGGACREHAIMRRRELVLMLATGAAAWPLALHAEQVRHIGAVMLYPENDPQGKLRADAFRGQLEKAGWTVGGNLQIDYQWGTGDAAWVHAAVERALKLSPEVLLANGDAAAHSALQLSKTTPVIFIGS